MVTSLVCFTSSGLPRCLLLLVVAVSAPPLEDEEEREITFVTEHKTGSEFAFQVVCCLAPRAEGRVRTEWMAANRFKLGIRKYPYQMPLKWGKIVLMIRNPYELVRSNYFYSLGCDQNPLCLRDEPQKFLPAERTIGQEALMQLREKPLPNETYNAYLHRMSLADGVLAVMAGHATKVLRNLERNLQFNAGQDRILTVCLDDVFRAFNKTMQVILQHFRVATNRQQERCLEGQDPAQRGFSVRSHGTHHVGGEDRQKAMRIIKEYDAKFFGGRFGRSVFAELCGQDHWPGGG